MSTFPLYMKQSRTIFPLCIIIMASGFVYIYLAYLVLFRSFVLALIKYIFLEYQIKVIWFGEKKLKECFCCSTWLIHWYLLFRRFWLQWPLTFDFDLTPSLICCFGLTERLSKQYNMSTVQFEKIFFCWLKGSGNIIIEIVNNANQNKHHSRHCLCVLP